MVRAQVPMSNQKEKEPHQSRQFAAAPPLAVPSDVARG